MFMFSRCFHKHGTWARMMGNKPGNGLGVLEEWLETLEVVRPLLNRDFSAHNNRNKSFLSSGKAPAIVQH